MKKIAFYNEKCLVITQDVEKFLINANGLKVWVTKLPENVDMLDYYREVRTELNYHPLIKSINQLDEFVFTSDGRNATLHLQELKLITSYENYI
jgi:hypothetical protein